MIEQVSQYPEWLEWIPFLVYYFAAVPQIITNYRNQSVAGLSLRMVFFDYVGATSTTIYTFFLWLPLACRVMEPLMAFNIGVLAVQGYLYAREDKLRRNITIAYMIWHAVCLGALGMGVCHRAYVGHMMGWLSLVVQCFTQLPQVVKNYRRRSVRGLSFLYMSMLGLASTLEMFVAYIFALPMQSLLNGLRGAIYYVILCWQFYRYRHTMKKWW